jgi:hypothetical protein
MSALKCEKPATALHGEPASNVDQLGGEVNLTNTRCQANPQASRRLIGTRYSPAIPQTALAAALLTALKRRAGT